MQGHTKTETITVTRNLNFEREPLPDLFLTDPAGNRISYFADKTSPTVHLNYRNGYIPACGYDTPEKWNEIKQLIGLPQQLLWKPVNGAAMEIATFQSTPNAIKNMLDNCPAQNWIR